MYAMLELVVLVQLVRDYLVKSHDKNHMILVNWMIKIKQGRDQ
jgi:hypothetical protein